MTDMQIQGALHAMNYSPGPLDGDPYGPLGYAAIGRAQSGYGIAVDEDPGPITQGCLSGQLMVIQQKLKDKGYYHGDIDGLWGPMINKAIEDFQRDNNLDVDGIVGENTSVALFGGPNVSAPTPAAQAPAAVTGNVSAPSGDLSGKVICINPGHGGSDPGACGNLLEKDMNLIVALRLGQLLSERGAQVHYTRTTDVWMALSDRPAIANSVGADIFISIHHNGSSNPSTSYSMAITYPGSAEGLRLGQNVLNGIANRLGLPNQGITQRDDSDVTYSDMPAVITEASFASSPADCALFNNGGAELEALGILDGVLVHFG